jgi:hypothetical protein
MTWLLWRQHRSQALVTGVAVALFALAVLLTGVHMANVLDAARNCGAATNPCGFGGNLFSGYGAIIDTVHLTIVVPLLLGAFFGASLIARETEHATNVLVWTQTVTRRRWLFTKVATALGATVVISGVVSALVTWWSGTPNSFLGNRFEGAEFSTQNIVPVAFALFAVALGLAAGSLLRRTLPALATTVGVYGVVQVLVSVYVRPHFAGVVTKTYALAANANPPSGSWTVSQNLVDASGHSSNGPIAVPNACRAVVDRQGPEACLGKLGYHTVIRFHPASQYWRFQWAETGLYLVLAAALVAFAMVHTLRHDA